MKWEYVKKIVSIKIFLPAIPNPESNLPESDEANFIVDVSKDSKNFVFRKPDSAAFAKISTEASWFGKRDYHCTICRNVDTSFFLMVLSYIENLSRITTSGDSPVTSGLEFVGAILGNLN